MPSIETSIWLALKARIDTLVTDPVMQAFDPGATFTPPSDAQGAAPYLLISDARNDVDRVTIGPELHTRTGTLGLSIRWPITRRISHIQLVEIAGTIAAHFPPDLCMNYGAAKLRVIREPDVLQPYIEDGHHVSIVRILWRMN